MYKIFHVRTFSIYAYYVECFLVSNHGYRDTGCKDTGIHGYSHVTFAHEFAPANTPVSQGAGPVRMGAISGCVNFQCHDNIINRGFQQVKPCNLII